MKVYPRDREAVIARIDREDKDCGTKVFLDIRETAAYLCLSIGRVDRLTRHGDLIAVRLPDKTVRYELREARRMFDAMSRLDRFRV